jgi:transcriptional regulator with XRE-family HTH domain
VNERTQIGIESHGTVLRRYRDSSLSAPTSNHLGGRLASLLLPGAFAFSAVVGGTSAHVTKLQDFDHAKATTYQVNPWLDSVSSTADYPLPPEVRPSPGESAIAMTVRSFRERSGLSWNELSNALGVSRRTLYNWSIGSSVSAVHAQSLGAFATVLGDLDVGDPKLTRAALLAPQPEGQSAYERFRSERYLTRRPLPELPQSRLMKTQPDGPDVSGDLTDFEPI